MEIRVVSLDFAGVIVSKDFIDYFWFVAIPKRLARLEKVPLYVAMKLVEEAYGRVPTNRLEWYLPSYWSKVFGLEHVIDECIEESIHVAEVYGEVFEVLPKLATRYIVVIATNTLRSFVERVLQRFGLDKYIRRVFTCIEDVGEPRKSARFYSHIVEELGVKPQHVLHVGDDPRYDGEEPARIGIRTLILDRSSRLSTAFKDLWSVLDILRS